MGKTYAQLRGHVCDGRTLAGLVLSCRKEREKWGTVPFGRKKKNFVDDLSNSGPGARLCGEGRATGPLQRHYRKKNWPTLRRNNA